MLDSRRPLTWMLLLLAGAGVIAPVAAQQQQQQDDDRGRHAPPQASGPRHSRQARAPIAQAAPLPERAFRERDRGQDALSDSIRRIERNTRGQVLSAERVPYDGRSVNRIKVVDDRGRVRIYMDDPQDGQPPAVPTRGDDD